MSIRRMPRLGYLYRHGSRYIYRERGGEWGVAATTLPILLLRLRGEPWHTARLYRLEEGGPVPVSSADVVKAVEEAGPERVYAPVKSRPPARHPRNHERWTEAEDEQLPASRLSDKELADELGRTPAAVMQRKAKLRGLEAARRSVADAR